MVFDLPAPVLAFLILLPATESSPAFPHGIGVIGDSYSDEYQFQPGARSGARNWLEILASLRGFDFGPLSTTSRSEPRRQGYAYNWARADATSSQAIDSGQHTGLARQVASGQVQLVMIFIGGNDFINALHAPNPRQQVDRALEDVRNNLPSLIHTLQEASPNVSLILVTVPDIHFLPDIAAEIKSGQIPQDAAQAATHALSRFNAQIRTLSWADPDILLIDFDLSSRLFTSVDPQSVPFGSTRLDLIHTGNSLNHLFLNDGRHPGTLAQGIFAQMFVECLRTGLDADVPSLTAQEVEDFARTLQPR